LTTLAIDLTSSGHERDRAAAFAGIRAIERRIGTPAAYHLVANDPLALDAVGAGNTVLLYERLAELAGAGDAQ
jgi:hypothetical protein